MEHITYFSGGPADTDRLGAALARVLPVPLTIALSGTLGAGKTRLVQAMAESLGIDRQSVVSPTFVLCQEYHGTRSLYHLDAYRVKDDDEFLELGVDEYFAADAITIVEWAERVENCLPESRLLIRIEVTGESERLFWIEGIGDLGLSVIPLISNELATPSGQDSPKE